MNLPAANRLEGAGQSREDGAMLWAPSREFLLWNGEIINVTAFPLDHFQGPSQSWITHSNQNYGSEQDCYKMKVPENFCCKS